MIIFMVGIQGSGKSTQAKILAEKYNAKIFNADTYRINFPNANNDKIFTQLYKDAFVALAKGNNIIFDNTNISLKKRTNTIKNIRNKFPEEMIVAYIMNTPFEECVKRVKARNEHSPLFVPEEVIIKYRNNFETPLLSEGFDKIIVHNIYSETEALEELNKQWKQMHLFEQNNPHHTHLLGQHCQIAGETYRQNLATRNTFCEKRELILGAFFHDIGKMFTQTFDSSDVAHYYGHHNAGAYYLLSKCFSRAVSLTTIQLINYHMGPYFWKNESTINKYKRLLSIELYLELSEFNLCDKQAK